VFRLDENNLGGGQCPQVEHHGEYQWINLEDYSGHVTSNFSVVTLVTSVSCHTVVSDKGSCWGT
jgi:DNA/RNA endonuclease G (NUC1)